jgi:hypothetical protein
MNHAARYKTQLLLWNPRVELSRDTMSRVCEVKPSTDVQSVSQGANYDSGLFSGGESE